MMRAGSESTLPEPELDARDRLAELAVLRKIDKPRLGSERNGSGTDGALLPSIHDGRHFKQR
jgi:hypothetical protein